MTASRHGAELKGSQEVVSLQVLVVVEDLLEGHPGREKFEQHRHRVAQTANHGLAVADVRVRGDAVEAGHMHIVSRNRLSPAVPLSPPVPEGLRHRLAGQLLELAGCDQLPDFGFAALPPRHQAPTAASAELTVVCALALI